MALGQEREKNKKVSALLADHLILLSLALRAAFFFLFLLPSLLLFPSWRDRPLPYVDVCLCVWRVLLEAHRHLLYRSVTIGWGTPLALVRRCRPSPQIARRHPSRAGVRPDLASHQQIEGQFPVALSGSPGSFQQHVYHLLRDRGVPRERTQLWCDGSAHSLVIVAWWRWGQERE